MAFCLQKEENPGSLTRWPPSHTECHRLAVPNASRRARGNAATVARAALCSPGANCPESFVPGFRPRALRTSVRGARSFLRERALASGIKRQSVSSLRPGSQKHRTVLVLRCVHINDRISSQDDSGVFPAILTRLKTQTNRQKPALGGDPNDSAVSLHRHRRGTVVGKAV